MRSLELRLFGFSVAEIVCGRRTEVRLIDNTGGQFELGVEALSPDYDEEYEEDLGFGFRGV